MSLTVYIMMNLVDIKIASHLDIVCFFACAVGNNFLGRPLKKASWEGNSFTFFAYKKTNIGFSAAFYIFICFVFHHNNCNANCSKGSISYKWVYHLFSFANCHTRSFPSVMYRTRSHLLQVVTPNHIFAQFIFRLKWANNGKGWQRDRENAVNYEVTNNKHNSYHLKLYWGNFCNIGLGMAGYKTN